MKHGARPFKRAVSVGVRLLGGTPKSYSKNFHFEIGIVHSSPDMAAQSEYAIPLEDAIDFAKGEVENIMRKKIRKDAGVTVLIAEKGTVH